MNKVAHNWFKLKKLLSEQGVDTQKPLFHACESNLVRNILSTGLRSKAGHGDANEQNAICFSRSLDFYNKENPALRWVWDKTGAIFIFDEREISARLKKAPYNFHFNVRKNKETYSFGDSKNMHEFEERVSVGDFCTRGETSIPAKYIKAVISTKPIKNIDIPAFLYLNNEYEVYVPEKTEDYYVGKGQDSTKKSVEDFLIAIENEDNNIVKKMLPSMSDTDLQLGLLASVETNNLFTLELLLSKGVVYREALAKSLKTSTYFSSKLLPTHMEFAEDVLDEYLSRVFDPHNIVPFLEAGVKVHRLHYTRILQRYIFKITLLLIQQMDESSKKHYVSDILSACTTLAEFKKILPVLGSITGNVFSKILKYSETLAIVKLLHSYTNTPITLSDISMLDRDISRFLATELSKSELNTSLLDACTKGKTSDVRILLAMGADPNTEHAFTTACETNTAISVFLPHIKDPSEGLYILVKNEHPTHGLMPEYGDKALVFAAKYNDVDTADKLIDLGASITYKAISVANKYKSTDFLQKFKPTLLQAVKDNDKVLVDKLAKNSEDLLPALDLALENEKFAITKILLKYVDINTVIHKVLEKYPVIAEYYIDDISPEYYPDIIETYFNTELSLSNLRNRIPAQAYKALYNRTDNPILKQELKYEIDSLL